MPSGRPPDQLAREVREHINDSLHVDSTMALAALAELQAQAEAGRFARGFFAPPAFTGPSFEQTRDVLLRAFNEVSEPAR